MTEQELAEQMLATAIASAPNADVAAAFQALFDDGVAQGNSWNNIRLDLAVSMVAGLQRGEWPWVA